MKLDKKYTDILDKYYDVFGATFPLFHSDNIETGVKDAKTCLEVGERVEVLFPDQYGECTGKNV